MEFEKQAWYTDEKGLDWIDECAGKMSPEAFRGAMRFVIGKYERRLGKKDAVSLELHKIADYYHRWAQYEKGLES